MSYNIKVNPSILDDFSGFVDSFTPKISGSCSNLTSATAALSSAVDEESLGEIKAAIAQITSILEGVEPELRHLSSGVKSYAEGVRRARAAMG